MVREPSLRDRVLGRGAFVHSAAEGEGVGSEVRDEERSNLCDTKVGESHIMLVMRNL